MAEVGIDQYLTNVHQESSWLISQISEHMIWWCSIMYRLCVWQQPCLLLHLPISTTMHCSSCVILFLHESRLSLTRTSEPHRMEWRFQQKFCAIFVCHKHSARPKLARVWRFHLHEAKFVLVSFRSPTDQLNWLKSFAETFKVSNLGSSVTLGTHWSCVDVL